MTRGAWPPCHRAGSSVHSEGDFTRDASGRKGETSLLKGVDLSSSSHALVLLHPSRPSAFWAPRWGAPVSSGEISVRTVPSGDLIAGELALVVVPVVLFSFYCC
jgi:hypothetical protein